jgi:methylene-tetrahydromethanopterin dehydrogenase
MPKKILHMLTPHKHVSPFDANMAADAGYDLILPYENVELTEVADLVQDAIFSRPPTSGTSTTIFFGGDDAILALDMMEAAKNALVPPFGVHVFADPQGSFTTAAAMVACVEKILVAKKGRGLAGRRVAVFGATGVVGYCSAVTAALEGAEVTLVGHSGAQRVRERAAQMKVRFGVDVDAVNGKTDAEKAAVLANTDIVFSAAKAGVRVLTAKQLEAAPGLLVVADVNAVPPAGIEGVGVFDNGTPMPGGETLGLGALAIGNVKYQTEASLFRRMLSSENEVLALDFRDAFKLAQTLVPDL